MPLAPFDYTTLVRDRTQEDEQKAKELQKKQWSDFTDEEKALYLSNSAKGNYNPLTDMNRVGACIADLTNVLNQRMGLAVKTNPKTDYAIGDYPTRAELEQYMNDIITIENALANYKGPSLYFPATEMNYSRANDIEQMLYDVRAYCSAMIGQSLLGAVAHTLDSKASTLRFGGALLYFIPNEAGPATTINFAMTTDTTTQYLKPNGVLQTITWPPIDSMEYPSSAIVKDDSLPDLPVVPVSDVIGVTVTGWYTDAAGTTMVGWDGVLVPPEGLTLYAKCRFSAVEFAISDTSDYDTTKYSVKLPNMQYINIGGQVKNDWFPETPAVPMGGTFEGKLLVGWNDDANMNGPNYGRETPTEVFTATDADVQNNAITFYAELRIHTITFAWVDGTNADMVADIVLPSAIEWVEGYRIYSFSLPELPENTEQVNNLGYFTDSAGTTLIGTDGVLITVDSTFYISAADEYLTGAYAARSTATGDSQAISLTFGGFVLYMRDGGTPLPHLMTVRFSQVVSEDADIPFIPVALPRDMTLDRTLNQDTGKWEVTLYEASIPTLPQMGDGLYYDVLGWYTDAEGSELAEFPLTVDTDEFTFYCKSVENDVSNISVNYTDDSDPVPEDISDKNYYWLWGGSTFKQHIPILESELLMIPPNAGSDVVVSGFYTDSAGTKDYPDAGITLNSSDPVIVYVRYKIVPGSGGFTAAPLSIDSGTRVVGLCPTTMTFGSVEGNLLVSAIMTDTTGIYGRCVYSPPLGTAEQPIAYTAIAHHASNDTIYNMKIVNIAETFLVVFSTATSIQTGLGAKGLTQLPDLSATTETLRWQGGQTPIDDQFGARLSNVKSVGDNFFILANEGQNYAVSELIYTSVGYEPFTKTEIANTGMYLQDIDRLENSFYIISCVTPGLTKYTRGYLFSKNLDNARWSYVAFPAEYGVGSVQPMPIVCSYYYTYVGLGDTIGFVYNVNVMLGDSWTYIKIPNGVLITVNRMLWTDTNQLVAIGQDSNGYPTCIYSLPRPGTGGIELRTETIAETYEVPVDVAYFQGKVQVIMKAAGQVANIYSYTLPTT